MKKTLKTLLAMMAGTMALAACSEDAMVENNNSNNNNNVAPGTKIALTFSAQQENDGSTRAAIDGTDSKKIDWQTADHISVFDGSSNNDFVIDEIDPSDATSATFTGEAADAATYTALYPYQSGAALSGEYITGVVLPATQTATPGSFDPAAGLMMAVTTGAEKNFAFKNAVAYIKVTTDVPAKEITFSSFDCEDIAGTVTLSYNSGTPTATVTSGGTDIVTLVPPTGEETIPAGTYYIAVLPQTLPFGFTLSYVDAEGVAHNRISNKEYTSVRNKVTNMGTINASNTYTNRQIVYYADAKITSFKNANVILNDDTEVYLEFGTGFTHEFSDGIGVITFEKDIKSTNLLFDEISSVTKVILPASIPELGSRNFGGTSIKELYLPKSITKIEDYSLVGIGQLEKLLLPKHATIGEGTIYYNPKLQAIYGPYTTPEHNAVIKDNVLLGVAGANIPAIPDGVTKIGKFVYGYASITGTFIIPQSVTTITDRAFVQCEISGDLVIPKSVSYIGEFAFENTNQLNSVTFEEGSNLTRIYRNTFTWSKARVTLPNSLTQIDQKAFYAYNTNQPTKTNIVIPDNVTMIDQMAFYQASNIESITFGAKLSSVGSMAFGRIGADNTHSAPAAEQTNLKYIYSKNPTPPTLASDVFQYTQMGDIEKIYVPRASVEAYKAAAVWSSYASKIEGYDF